MQIVSQKNLISVNFESNMLHVDVNTIVAGGYGGWVLAEYPTPEDAEKVFNNLIEWYADHPETRVYILPD